MGGIKNKLNKLSNKTIPLSDSCLTSPFSQRGTIEDKQSLPLGKGRQMSIAHRWGRYTKYLSIACLSLAILSTLILNIVSSYSSSKIESNAIDGNTSTLANDSSSISLSFSNATGSCTDTSNPANVCMEIPDGGGIATGGHTVTVNAPSDSDYRLTLSSANNETDLANGSNRIASISNPASIGTLNDLTDKAWGMSITTSGSAAADPIYGLQPVDNPLILIDTQSGNGIVSVGSAIDVQYGAKVMDPSLMPAGSYSANLLYTVTAVAPQPTADSFVLNDTVLTGQTKKLAINGENLQSTSVVWIDYIANGRLDEGEEASELETYPYDGTVVSFVNPVVTTPGEYSVYVQTDGGSTKLNEPLIVHKESICRNADPDSDCQVDIYDNMIPVVYEDYDGNGGGNWRIVTKEEIENNKGSWYDYGKKQWANAITLRDDYEGGCYFFRKDLLPERAVLWASGDACYDNSTIQHYTPLELAKMIRDESSTFKSLDNANVSLFDMDVSDGTSATEVILGYWVYIPRYAYEVQRRDATDKYVEDEYWLPNNTTIKNDFIINFETTSIPTKTPAVGCSISILQTPADLDDAIDYRTGCHIDRHYEGGGATTWGTHPAFTFDGQQLNGFWTGKFETTGTISEPTVKPNQHANIANTIADYFNAARVVAYQHKLSDSTYNAKSHLIKNGEWGAVAYLASSSYYGAGLENTIVNSASHTSEGSSQQMLSTDADGDGIKTLGQEKGTFGITGCGPGDNDSTQSYDDGTRLDQTTIMSPTACSQNVERAYNGRIGVLASTTNNIYGVYDMSGGVYEFVGAGNAYSEPWFNRYESWLGFDTQPSWSIDSNALYYNIDVCTWESCGGQAMHETKLVQSVSGDATSWGETFGTFPYDHYSGTSRSTMIRSSTPVYSASSTLFYHEGYNRPTSTARNDIGYRVSIV